MLYNLLQTIITNPINILILSSMMLFFIFGLWQIKNKHIEFVNYIPTLLTTLGIFGTFLGIVLGLLNFDQNNINASIPALLEGLKTAFITSIVGIFLSILFKIVTILKNQKTTTETKVEKSISHATPETILTTMQEQLIEMKSLKEAMVGTEESTLFSQLKLLRTDLNDNAKASITNTQTIANNQQEQLNKVTNQLWQKTDDQKIAFEQFSTKLWLQLTEFADTLSKSATEQVIEALKQVILDFNNNLTEQFGDNFKQLNSAVEKLVTWQENYKEQLIQMQQQYALGVKSISATESSVTEISEQTKKIPETMQALNAIIEINQHQLAELERHLETFKDMRDKAVEAVPQIQQHVEGIVTGISAAMTCANEHYSALLTESEQHLKSHIDKSNDMFDNFVTETDKGISLIGERLVESSDRINQEVEKAAEQFAQSTEHTNQSLTQTSDQLQSQTHAIEQAFQKSMTELNGSLQQVFDDFTSETDKGISLIGERLVESSVRINQEVENAAETFVSGTEQANKSLNHASEQLEIQGHQMAKTLKESLAELNINLRDMLDTIVSNQQEMSSTLKTANKHLINDTAEIREHLVDFSEDLQNQIEAMIAEAANQQTQQAQRTFDSMEAQIKQHISQRTSAIDSQVQSLDLAMQQEINRVMNEMGNALAKVTGKFVEDYIKLTEAMNKVINQRVI